MCSHSLLHVVWPFVLWLLVSRVQNWISALCSSFPLLVVHIYTSIFSRRLFLLFVYGWRMKRIQVHLAGSCCFCDLWCCCALNCTPVNSRMDMWIRWRWIAVCGGKNPLFFLEEERILPWPGSLCGVSPLVLLDQIIDVWLLLDPGHIGWQLVTGKFRFGLAHVKIFLSLST